MRHEIIKQKHSIAHRTIQSYPCESSTPKMQASQFTTIQEGKIAESTEGRQESERRPMIAHFQKKVNDSLQYKILKNVFRNKDQESPKGKANIKSEKLVGKESFIVRELSPQVARPVKGRIQLEDSPQRKEENINQLLRLNNNLRNITGETNAFLLKSIEMLRCSEKNYLPNANEDQHARKESIVDLATLEDNANQDRQQTQENCSILRTLKEQAALRFKEKIKIKQSRRHIYRTLKNKNQNWQKIRQKTHQISPQKERAATEIKENSELQLMKVQCTQGKQISYNIRSSNFRSLTKTYYDNMRELRVQSKQQSQQGQLGLELRTTKCQFGATDAEEEGKSWSKGKRKSGIEVYEEVISKMRKGKSERDPDLTSNCSPRKNVFRELTPWHFQE